MKKGNLLNISTIFHQIVTKSIRKYQMCHVIVNDLYAFFNDTKILSPIQPCVQGKVAQVTTPHL